MALRGKFGFVHEIGFKASKLGFDVTFTFSGLKFFDGENTDPTLIFDGYFC